MKVTEIIRERCECASFCSLSGVVRQIPLFRGVDFLGGVRRIEKTGRPPWAGIVRSLATTEPPAHRG